MVIYVVDSGQFNALSQTIFAAVQMILVGDPSNSSSMLDLVVSRKTKKSLNSLG